MKAGYVSQSFARRVVLYGPVLLGHRSIQDSLYGYGPPQGPSAWTFSPCRWSNQIERLYPLRDTTFSFHEMKRRNLR